ncbi:site-specific DNA-methyltransferase [Priestia aryabhattai]
MEKIKGNSLRITDENVKAIKNLFPEVMVENKIDFEKLKQLLGESIESGEERYQFTWNGKSNAIQHAQTPSMATLLPDKKSSENWDSTENVYIEGDNLEALKLLQKSYFGKINMIYIDPPYNTGKDFIYADNFYDSVANYKEQTHQLTKVNAETNGRYHTDWLNMMYPRLKVARTLLAEDGAIFISIDDNEAANLKKLCDEIFGEDNFVSEIIWEKKFSPQNDAKYFSLNHEQIYCYAKNKNKFNRNLLPATEEQIARYKNPDNDPRGPWQSGDLLVTTYSEKYDYPITIPSGRIVNPPSGRCWRVSQEKLLALVNDNRIWFGKDGNGNPRIKRFLSEVNQGIVPISIWKHSEVGHTQGASHELRELFDGKKYFDFPKPVSLIKQALMIASSKESIVLDFFAGSSTTAHAVMELNAEDEGNRKFIMVQLDELTDEKSEAHKSGYSNICEIGKDRIRRAGEKIKKETGEEIDTGFKVFKLESSNIKEWNPDAKELINTLFAAEESLVKGRTEEDLFYEIILKSGLQLTVPVVKQKTVHGEFYNIAFGAAFVCLDSHITTQLAEMMLKEVGEDAEPKFIFKEAGFVSDSEKVNVLQTLSKKGIHDVRSV